jgi:hypothetical protein
LLILVPAVLFVSVFALHVGSHKPESSAVYPPESTNYPEWLALLQTPTEANIRPIYPYSIVPGGVRDAKELRAASAADHVVAQHYSNFKLAKARTIRLDHPLAMYVSFRRDNKVFWTRNRMIIPAGETLISDGENFARTRCANRLSKDPVKPVAESEPSAEELSDPSFAPPLIAGLVPSSATESFLPPPTSPGPFGPPSGGSTLPVLPPILLPGGRPITNSPIVPPPPVNAPEPSSFSLLLAGIASLVLVTLLTHRR